MYIEFIPHTTLLYKQNSDTGQFNINLREKTQIYTKYPIYMYMCVESELNYIFVGMNDRIKVIIRTDRIPSITGTHV